MQLFSSSFFQKKFVFGFIKSKNFPELKIVLKNYVLLRP